MANATWPASLPAAPVAGTGREVEHSGVQEDKMEVGPPIVRRRTTLDVYLIQVQLRLTGAQLATLRDFYRTTLKKVLPFDGFADPEDVSQTLVGATFTEKGIKSQARGADRYDLSFELWVTE